MSGSRLILRNARLVYADGAVVRGGLICSSGIIESVFAGNVPPGTRGNQDIDAEGHYVIPGLIDPHVQLYAQDDVNQYASESRSAALGGVTTIMKMHRDLLGYATAEVKREIEAAESRAYVDFTFHLAIMSDEQIDAIPGYVRDLGVNSFKLFLAYRGPEGRAIGIQGVDDGQFYHALREIGAVRGVALVHCENQELANRARRDVESSHDQDDLRIFTRSRPCIVEAEAVGRAAFLAQKAACRLYIVHISCRESLEVVARARSTRAEIAVETAPHYLTETYDSAASTLAKVIPPLRSSGDRAALWRALANREIDTIGSDHVPTARGSKSGSVWDASLGFPGVATILPILLSEGVNRRRLRLSDVVATCSTNPARIFGLRTKGALLPGRDADFVVVDLGREREVDASILGSAADFSIYEGRTLRGWPTVTVSRGQTVMQEGIVVGKEGRGRFLRRRHDGSREEREPK